MAEEAKTTKTPVKNTAKKTRNSSELAKENSVGIYHKLHAIQSEVGKMAKTGKNTAQNYNYLTESDISEKFKDLLVKYGVVFTYCSSIDEVRPSPTGKQIITDVTVNYEFIDIDTEEKVTGYAAGQGSDATDKGVYKAITGAVKYIFMKTFLIPTGDDPEMDAPKRAKQASYDKPPFGAGSEEEEED